MPEPAGPAGAADPLLALLPKAKRRWARSDPVLHALAKEHPPTARSVDHAPPFAALVGSIAHQQVSLAAGRAIYARVEAAAGGAVTPEGILKAGPDTLRAAGLSRPKVAYVLDLAEKAQSGAVEFARFPQMADDDIIRELVAVKGIGVWTAKMFLIFHLDRPDVSPHEDLGVQLAVAQAYKVPRARAAKKIQAMAPLWAPYNSVAALALWHWRHVMAGDTHAAKPAEPAVTRVTRDGPRRSAGAAGRRGSRGFSGDDRKRANPGAGANARGRR